MAKTSLQTKDTNEAKYVTFVENIIAKLTENVAEFDNLDPTLVDLENSLTAFKKAQADAAFRDMRYVVIKNQLFAALKRMIYELSLYVEKVAKGDPAIIMAAGFVPTKTSTVVGSAPKPQNMRVIVNVDVPGLAELKVNCWRHALVYQFEYRKKDAGAEWQKVLSSKARMTLAGLESMSQYEFRVAYISRNPLITYSDIVSSAIF